MRFCLQLLSRLPLLYSTLLSFPLLSSLLYFPLLSSSLLSFSLLYSTLLSFPLLSTLSNSRTFICSLRTQRGNNLSSQFTYSLYFIRFNLFLPIVSFTNRRRRDKAINNTHSAYLTVSSDGAYRMDTTSIPVGGTTGPPPTEKGTFSCPVPVSDLGPAELTLKSLR